MEAMRRPDIAPRSEKRLTKLYTDTKISYRTAVPQQAPADSPEMTSVHRKFRIQKDRLIAWGLDWSDGISCAGCPEGAIDDSVEQAGLTEIVSSVLENIRDALDELEGLCTGQHQDAEKHSLALAEERTVSETQLSHFQDLVKDLTTAIDLLCDLSRSQRRGNLGSENAAKLKDSQSANATESQALNDFVQSAHEALESFRAVLPPTGKIDTNDIILPEEAPPPYESFGMPAPVRIVGRLRISNAMTDSRGVEHPQTTVPVLVEYASFDPVYQNGVDTLPHIRLEHLQQMLGQSHADRPTALLNFVGHFEDRSRPRIGLVFELPRAARLYSSHINAPASRMQPASLFQLLQNASKSNTNSAPSNIITVPPLEERFRLALSLASSFAYLLESGFVHRDVSSTSVSFLPRAKAPLTDLTHASQAFDIRRPVIGSFDLFHEYDIERQPENIQVNIYRHFDDPRVTGEAQSRSYEPRYDIYSLGLVLLEIGLWLPLADFWKEKYNLKDFSRRLEKIWARRLASKCGSAYMNAVQECLRAGLDSSYSPASLKRSYERICAKLQRCTLLDDHDDSASEGPGPADPLSKDPLSQQQSATSLPTTPAERTDAAAAVGAFAPGPEESGESMDVDYQFSSRSRLSEKPKTYRYGAANLPQHAKDLWPVAGARLAKVVNRALRHCPRESSSIGLELCGESRSTARPTFCVMCTSTEKVSKAIRKWFEYDSSVFDLVIYRGKIRRSHAHTVRRSRGSRRSAVKRSGSGDTDAEAKNPFYHQRPLCGASIGAWRDGEHLPPVSFGGVITIDGEPYGMSVHHILEDSAEDDMSDNENGDAMRSSAPSYSHTPNDDVMVVDDDSDFDSDFDSDEEEDEDDAVGDSEGVFRGEGEDIVITQPALDDVVDGFFPRDEDRDEDHIDSHALGYVYASSGLRRVSRSGLRHEVDWALMKLKHERLQPHNIVAGGAAFCSNHAANSTDPDNTTPLLEPVCRKDYPASSDVFPRSIARTSELAGLQVHGFGRTSGLRAGRISELMKFVRMPGRRGFSQSWTVAGGLGVGGDSGAWVIDNASARVCGHVLAWSDESAEAYIAPMDIMLADIQSTLAVANIGLPGGDSLPPDNNPGVNKLHTPANTGSAIGARATASPPERGMATLDLDAAGRRRNHALAAQANSFLLSGRPDHMEREWTSRRATLGRQLVSG